jgi:hypothetical protein
LLRRYYPATRSFEELSGKGPEHLPGGQGRATRQIEGTSPATYLIQTGYPAKRATRARVGWTLPRGYLPSDKKAEMATRQNIKADETASYPANKSSAPGCYPANKRKRRVSYFDMLANRQRGHLIPPNGRGEAPGACPDLAYFSELRRCLCAKSKLPGNRIATPQSPAWEAAADSSNSQIESPPVHPRNIIWPALCARRRPLPVKRGLQAQLPLIPALCVEACYSRRGGAHAATGHPGRSPFASESGGRPPRGTNRAASAYAQ